MVIVKYSKFFPELVRHNQAPRLSLRGAEPPWPALQEASQDDGAET